MKHKIISLFAFAMMLCSCEYEFEIDNTNKPPRMFVECFGGHNEATVIEVYKAMPVGGEVSDGRDFQMERISLTVDGKEVSLHQTDPSQWYTDEPLPAGSTLELSLKASGIEAIHAQSVVPEQPGFEVSLFPFDLGNAEGVNMVGVHLVLDKAVDDNDHLGLCIWTRDKSNTNLPQMPLAVYDLTSSVLDLGLANYPDVMIRNGLDTSISVALVDNTKIKDGKSLDCLVVENIYEETPVMEYQVVLFRLSPEAYGYINSTLNIKNNYLALLGLCQSDFAYTNISGGYGVLGGVSASGSEWMDSPYCF